MKDILTTQVLVPFLIALSATVLRWFELKILKQKVEGINNDLKTAKNAISMTETNDAINSAMHKTSNILNRSKNSVMKTVLLIFTLCMSIVCSGQTSPATALIYLEAKSIDSSYIAKHDSFAFKMVFFNNSADTIILSYAKVPIAFNSGTLTDSVPLKFYYKPGSATRLPAVQKNNIAIGISQQNSMIQISVPAVVASIGLKLAPGDTVSFGTYAISGLTRASGNISFCYSYVPNFFPTPQGRYYSLISTPPTVIVMSYKTYIESSNQLITWRLDGSTWTICTGSTCSD